MCRKSATLPLQQLVTARVAAPTASLGKESPFQPCVDIESASSATRPQESSIAPDVLPRDAVHLSKIITYCGRTS